MKRLWIGAGLLAAMLLLCFLAPEVLDRGHGPVIRDLRRAAELAMVENWEQAERVTGRAEENWKEKRPVTASLAKHEPMDDIDGMFEQLKIYAAAREKVAYSSTCVYLSSRLEALGAGHEFTLWNLF